MHHYKLQLTAALNALTGIRRDLALERSADEIDNVIAMHRREMESQLAHNDAKRIREIRAALDRIADGSFGECIECEERISERRLNAAPWAARCIKCQEEFDQAQSVQWQEAA